MLEYKIYFNGKRFVMEKEKSVVESTSRDSVESCNISSDTGMAAVDSLNRSYKLNKSRRTY